MIKSWHVSPSTIHHSLPPQKKYVLLPATGTDQEKVLQCYSHHPVEGYAISKVEVILNPEFNRSFSIELSRLQEKSTSDAFAPKWALMDGADQRKVVIDIFTALARPHTDPSFPQVHLLPAWHGTRPDLLDSIFRVGYSNLSFTDTGFFGKGLYSTHEAEYAHRVYSRGALILNWVATFSPFPVIKEDMSFLTSYGNYGNYDAHFVPVTPRNPKNSKETVYYPCSVGQDARYHELVVFQTAACLPRYLVHLERTLLKNPSSPQENYTPGGTLPSDYGAGEFPGSGQIFDDEKKSTEGAPQKEYTPGSTVSSSYGVGDFPDAGQIFGDEKKSADAHTKPSDHGHVEEVLPSWQEIEEQRLLEEAKGAIKEGLNDKARKCLESLAKIAPEEPQSGVLLGWLYENGVYPQDTHTKKKAQEAYLRAYQNKHQLLQAAESTNDPEVHYLIGLLFSHCPQATTQEKQQALQQFIDAAKKGHAGAQREVGICYQSGRDNPPDDVTAAYSYQSAAELGDIRGMYYFATCLAKGSGIPKDQSAAINWYQKAAEKGDVLSQNNLGLCYEQGHWVKQDFTKAVYYYELAAIQGYELAQHNLGVIYENGRLGVKQDLVKAAQYYQLAAGNLPRAQNNLAHFYEHGLGGLPKDMNEAFRLYEVAASQGYARAQFNLGVCYEVGYGTVKDLDKAKHYFTLAANAKERISPEAEARLSQIKTLQNATTGFCFPPQKKPF